MHSVAVFCGSSAGNNPNFAETAAAVGRLLAEQGIHLVYGGATVGIMGAVANAVLAAGGDVTGVIPKDLFPREVPHRGLTQLLEVDSMHTRKQRMYELSDAFIILPGGLGTLDELFEVWTWNQIGIHAKPIGLLNTDDYFDHLLKFLDHAESEKFLYSARGQLITSATPDDLLPRLAAACSKA